MAQYNQNYDIFLGSTQSFCHFCKAKKLIDTHIVSKGNEVFLRKFCPTCGENFVKISTDLEYFKKCENYLKQPDLPETSLTEVKIGCPWDCGVCPQHQNHPCLALFNVTDECNMKCNICYHKSEPGKGNYKSLSDIKLMHLTLLRVESKPDLIQVTGGEPTLHPEILDILKYLKSGPVRHLMLNTNGIKIANDENFVKELKKLGPGFEVYLQFDSLNENSLKILRNQNMLETRKKALEMLNKYEISTTLVCVISREVNDNEIGELIDFATREDCVRGIVFQPISDVGRNISKNEYRITLSEIRENIIKQNKNGFTSDDMIPLPCDPHKIGVGYAIKMVKNGDINILPVTGKIPREVITHQKGTVAFEQDKDFIKTVIETVSLDTAMGENILKDRIKRKLFCCWPDFIAPESMSYKNVFRIVIMEFSDMYNFDSTNIKRECNFIIEPGKAYPFSTYNMLYNNN
ncbi:MAG: radical SAM protein [Candidatus Gracilibacteria bacterium]|nr:radical SAM protein [Candidatus Gracilibacteria bacterium]